MNPIESWLFIAGMVVLAVIGVREFIRWIDRGR
jgi:hypothetical protein